jgi:hypothetical protein
LFIYITQCMFLFLSVRESCLWEADRVQ